MNLSPEAEAEIERLISSDPLSPEYHYANHARALRSAMRWAYADAAKPALLAAALGALGWLERHAGDTGEQSAEMWRHITALRAATAKAEGIGVPSLKEDE